MNTRDVGAEVVCEPDCKSATSCESSIAQREWKHGHACNRVYNQENLEVGWYRIERSREYDILERYQNVVDTGRNY